MTQTNSILNYLQQGNTITPIEALNLFGCFRLSARILELRAKGFNITTELAKGEKRYAKYKLVK